MSTPVQKHYGRVGAMAEKIAAKLAAAGKDLGRLTTADLSPIDEFHIRGRAATLELADRMELRAGAHVLDVGSGLGGPARTLAETYGCVVTGIDLTPEFCVAANELSRWVGLADRTTFVQGDATSHRFDAGAFDAAMTLHVAMNIARKDAMYACVFHALKPGAIFAVYDVLQGEGGPPHFPVPWAGDASISHLVTPGEMRTLLGDAGFTIVEEIDHTEQCLAWFRERATRAAAGDVPPVTLQSILEADMGQMFGNLVRSLAERRARPTSYLCRRSA